MGKGISNMYLLPLRVDAHIWWNIIVYFIGHFHISKRVPNISTKLKIETNSYFNGQRNSKGRGEITPHLSPLAKANFFSNQVQICARLETQLQPIK